MFRILAATIVIVVVTLWMWHAFVMGNMDQMSDCPFMDMTVLCTMTPLEHVSILRNLLTALPPDQILSVVLFVVSVLMVLACLLREASLSLLFFKSINSLTKKHFSAYNLLREAFSSGILHSKIYNVVL